MTRREQTRDWWSGHPFDRSPGTGPMDRARSGAPVVRASSPREVLSLVPYLLGFQPEESLVMVVIGGQRVVLTARLDLPLSAAGDVAACTQLAEIARQHGAEAVVLAVFSDDGGAASDVLRTAEEAFGDLLVSAWVTDGAYYCMVSGGVLGVRERYEPTETAAVASAVYEGLSVLPSRRDVAARVAPGSPSRCATVAALCHRRSLPCLAVAKARMTELVDSYRQVRLITDDELAELLVLCRSLSVRDLAWIAMTRDVAEVAVDLWGQVARAAPPAESAPPVCLMGMAAWLSGDGALMLCCAERVQTEHPGYSMGQLLNDLVAAAIHPKEWRAIREHLITGDGEVEQSGAAA